MFQLAVRRRQLDKRPAFPDRLEENGPRQGFFEHAEYTAVRREPTDRPPTCRQLVYDPGSEARPAATPVVGGPLTELELDWAVANSSRHELTGAGRGLFSSLPTFSLRWKRHLLPLVLTKRPNSRL